MDNEKVFLYMLTYKSFRDDWVKISKMKNVINCLNTDLKWK